MFFQRVLLTIFVLVALSTTARSEERVALVIGNGDYQKLQDLPNAKNDATQISSALIRLRFRVIEGYDLDNEGFRKKLIEFRKALATADVAVVFYAGHGVGINGQNYLIPVDAKMENADAVDLEAISLSLLRATIESRPITSIIFFDACRDDPFIARIGRSLNNSSKAFSGGWGATKAPKGSFVTFATSPGEVALDGVGNEKNSPFTQALLENINRPDLDIEIMMRSVRARVKELTLHDNKHQQVWSETSLTAGFMFAPSNKRSLGQWITSRRRRVPVGSVVELEIKPPFDCQLTLVNVDKKGKSCILYPHAGLPQKSLKGNQVTIFPPPPHELELNEVGTETFVAMCDATPGAISKETRNRTVRDCSEGKSDESFNGIVHELSTLRLRPKSQSKQAREKIIATRRMLRSTLTIEVVGQ